MADTDPTDPTWPTPSGRDAVLDRVLRGGRRRLMITRLAVAGAMLNTISVRSDVYAVWFVVRGYQQSDVDGLQPEDPMTPSVERRYVMVLDRSNVVRRGDKPKVLLFKEVPL